MDYEHPESAASLTLGRGIFYDDSTKGYYCFVGSNLVVLGNSLEEIKQWQPKLLELIDVNRMIPIDGYLPGFEKGVGGMANNDFPTSTFRIINADSLLLIRTQFH